MARWDEVRVKVDEIVQRLREDRDFQAEMKRAPEEALVRAGLGEDAAVILAEDWLGSIGGGRAKCDVDNSCRFTTSDDPCGPTKTTLRGCN